jgi:outer membrane protein assembly factor BamB
LADERRSDTHLVRAGIDAAPLLAELEGKPDAWFTSSARRSPGGSYRDTHLLRLRAVEPRPGIDDRDNHETRLSPVAGLLPLGMRFMENVAREVNGTLSRAHIVRIYPRSEVKRHHDGGEYHRVRHRYHVPLSPMTLVHDARRVEMAPGELWHVDNKGAHAVENPSPSFGLYYVFDVLPAEITLPEETSVPFDAGPPSWRAKPRDERERKALDALRAVLLAKAMVRSDKDTKLTGTGGRELAWALDLRPVFLVAEHLDAIADAFWDRFAEGLPFQLAGMEVAAIPLLIGLLERARQRQLTTSGIIVRKERKPHGRGQAIEGVMTDVPIVLVDDLLNSGESAEKARVTLEQAGRRVDRMFTVVDFQSERGAAWAAANKLPVDAMFTLGDLDKKPGKKQAPREPARSFEPAWRHLPKTGRPFHVVPKSAPLLVGERVFHGTDAATVLALDAGTGERLWELRARGGQVKGIWSSLAHHDGRLYFGAYDGNLYCAAAETGEILWRTDASDWIGASPLLLPERDLLFIGLEYERPLAKGSVAAFRLGTGEKVWEHSLLRFQHGSCAYWPEGDLVVTGSSDHEILALRATDGTVAWTSPMDRSAKYAPAIDAERRLVVCPSFDGNIYIVSLVDGRRVAAIHTDDLCYTTPLVVGKRVFCGSGDKNLYVVDLDRMQLEKTIPMGSRVFSSPRLVDGGVIVGTNGGVVREIDPNTLETLGQLMVPDAVTNAVAARPDGTRIFVLTYMNELYAFDRRRGG